MASTEPWIDEDVELASPSDDRVRRWMSKNPETVSPTTDLIDAYERMRQHRIRHLPVVSDGLLVGIISDRDLRHALPVPSRKGEAIPYGKNLFDTPVERLMTATPLTTDPDATIAEAAQILCRNKVSALPVVEHGKLVGIVTSEDLLWAFTEIRS